MPWVATNPKSSGGAPGLTMGMVYSTAMKSRRPHAKSAGSGCLRMTPATPAAEHHSGSPPHPSPPPAAAAPMATFSSPSAAAGWTLASLQRRRVVVAAAAGSRAAARLGGGMYGSMGWAGASVGDGGVGWRGGDHEDEAGR
nr:unnamed protein product [Digitaria exilis]